MCDMFADLFKFFCNSSAEIISAFCLYAYLDFVLQFMDWVDEGTKCPYCEGLGYTLCDLCEGKTVIKA